MKILYILSDTTPYGGASKSFMMLLRQVLSHGIEATVVMPDTQGIHDKIIELGAKTIVMPIRFATLPRHRNTLDTLLYIPRLIAWTYYNKTSERQICKLLSSGEYDIVHTNVSVVNVGLKACQQHGVPHVMHIREYANTDFDLHYLPSWDVYHQRLNNPLSYKIAITQDIAKHHGLKEDKTCRVVYNGIVSNYSAPDFENGTQDFLLFAGRIEPSKGLLLLLQAYTQYTKSVSCPIRLKVAGEVSDTTYKELVDDFIHKEQLEDFISFLGQVDNVKELYQTARATIVPSINEGFGRCMPEAMALGSLVIAHNTGGTKEQLDNGLALFNDEIALRFNNAEELYKHLMFVHKNQVNEEPLKEMRKKAFNTVTQLYTDTQNAKNTIQFYTDIINKKQ